MKKDDFIREMICRVGGTKTSMADTLEAFGQVCRTELLMMGEVSLPGGLGKLKVKTRAARKTRNPRTGAEVNTPEKKAVVFVPSKELGTVINKGPEF